jgi:hypothetical protein
VSGPSTKSAIGDFNNKELRGWINVLTMPIPDSSRRLSTILSPGVEPPSKHYGKWWCRQRHSNWASRQREHASRLAYWTDSGGGSGADTLTGGSDNGSFIYEDGDLAVELITHRPSGRRYKSAGS